MNYLIGAVICCYLIWLGIQNYKKHKEYNRKLKESLDDEYVLDPETNAKLTLEQAENGHWGEKENELGIMSEADIDTLYTEEEKEMARTANYLKKKCLKLELDSEQWAILTQTNIFNRYNDFRIYKPFKIKNSNGIFFFTDIEIGSDEGAPHRVSFYASGQQLMFWLLVDVDLGHYYFSDKTAAGKIIDKIKRSNDLNLKRHETVCFRRTENIDYVERIIKFFEVEKGFEIEFMDNNIFIKNFKYPNLEDVHRIERIVSSLEEISSNFRS